MRLQKYAILLDWLKTGYANHPITENLIQYAQVADWARKKYPRNHLEESISPNQLSSKAWMIEQLSRVGKLHGPWYTPEPNYSLGSSVEIVGSWYGFPLIDHLHEALPINDIKCWDIDFEARQIAEYYLEVFQTPNVEIFSQDYFAHEREGSRAHLLINTSSEHMKDTFWMMNDKFGLPREHLDNEKHFYVKRPVIAIQSNNMRHIAEHVNCVDSTDELIEKNKFKTIYYAGSQRMSEWQGLEIKQNDFHRFMVIGRLDNKD